MRLLTKVRVPLLPAAAIVVVGLLVLFGAIGSGSPGEASPQSTLGIDANTSGNSATSIAEIDGCVSRQVGDTFEVDVFIDGVTDLLAWEVYFAYDKSVLEVMDRNVKMLLASESGSSVVNVSDPVPNSKGLFRTAAADIAVPAATEDGTGVLARLTLVAKQDGVSLLTLPKIDVNSDGKADLGPILRDKSADPIDDDDGDTFYDGVYAAAVVAVGKPCEQVPEPTPQPNPSPTALPGFETPSPGTTPGPAQGSPGPGPDGTPGTADDTPWPGPDGIPGTADDVPGPGPDGTPGTADDTPAAPESTPPDGVPDILPGRGSSGGGSSAWLAILTAVVAAILALGGVAFFMTMRRTA